MSEARLTEVVSSESILENEEKRKDSSYQNMIQLNKVYERYEIIMVDFSD